MLMFCVPAGFGFRESVLLSRRKGVFLSCATKETSTYSFAASVLVSHREQRAQLSEQK
jgi:hypothetical protein